jgi:amino acid transporter
MVLSSAAASTQTTILPTARTTLSMAVYRSIPRSFERIHRRYLTPTVSTVVMGAVSVALYAVMNYISAGQVIKDSVDSLGVMIAFYYGLTGFSCTWYYRRNLTSNLRNFFMQGVMPTAGGLILFFILGWSFWYYWQPVNSYTHWGIFGRQIGGVFILDVGLLVIGVILMFAMQAFRPAFFRGETLNRDSATLVSEEFLTKQAGTK